MRTKAITVTVALIAVYFAVDLPRFVLSGFKVHKEGVVIVTGASTGIGLDAAKALGSRGFTVLAGVRSEAAVADVGLHPGVRGVLLDVTDDDMIVDAVHEAVRLSESLKIPFIGVVNNAGMDDNLPIEHLTRSRVAKVLDINLFGAIALVSEALPHLRASNGRVVNVGSLAGKLAAAGMQPYAASKAAMESFSDSLRREMVGLGVAVVQVDPGCVATPFFGKKNFESDNFHELPDSARAVYSRIFAQKYDYMKRCRDHAESPESSTTPAIIDAITSAYPRTRYFPSSWNGIPGFWIQLMSWTCHDLVTDILVSSPMPSWI